MSLSPERKANLDAMAEALDEAGGTMYAKAIEAAIGIGDGVTRTDAGDQLYRDAKKDPRFTKTEPGEATFTLTDASARTSASGTEHTLPEFKAFLAVGADKRNSMYHAPGQGEYVGAGRPTRMTTGCGLHLDPDACVDLHSVPLARRCRSNGCAGWWNDHEEQRWRHSPPLR